MGNRITHAAPHLSAQEVRERMQKEARLWCRRRWQIIYEALTAPRQAEEIARAVGVSLTTVHHVMARYKHEGVAAIETPGKGGRRRENLTLEQERTFLQPLQVRASQGERVGIAEIQQAYEEQVGHAVAQSTITRLLQRHGWRRHETCSRPAPVTESCSAGQERAAAHAPKEPKNKTRAKREPGKQRTQSP
jgi:transposase